ncbi:ABC-2 type transport system ATP-binding protein [Melghiribacillus thermohalophilus]|uniref:ABC-2 type transport system ATP-binding protein n=1 Tax=Melghiribacillus thermohalophilus TaxID=1324956 RepID=A0A4R3MR82_9BACI|nr:ATP-binding cassette domain-containing protein [Melghiribacillus thermohalophilus]TCT17502.1 ABC-2 type transport system ATP-binding protein [Melghiribacillus thermohalophilus]
MLQVSGLNKIIKKHKVLKNVHLNIEGIYGLIGPNGAGKTTLMKILSSLTSMNGGDVFIDGKNYSNGRYVKANKYIGYLPQDFMIYPKISVYEALDHIAILKGIMDKKIRQDKIVSSLEQVNLLEHQEKKMIELSGGMRKRVGIAQLLLEEPSCLLFDEPTAGLDIEERIRFRNLMKRLGNNHTIIISSHIIEDIEFLATKISILKKGEVLFEGTPEHLKKKAEGKIWTKPIQIDELNEFILNQDVISISEEQKNVKIRIFSEDGIDDNYKLATPKLVDGYLAVIREGHK